jgi:drug/metabolite transporter (DMT)-like permease
VNSKPSNNLIAATLLLSILLWGMNNAGTKYLIRFWPPIFIGCTRFLSAGLIIFALFRWTNIFGKRHAISAAMSKQLWWRGGLSLALYILAFNFALVFAPISHVAVYLGASPVWALLWEGLPQRNWRSLQRYGAAALAMCGVLVLFLPVLRGSSARVLGEILGLVSSVLWTNYGRQCRQFGSELSGAEITGQTFWRAALMLAPLAFVEVGKQSIPWRADLLLIHLFCIFGSGVVAFALWNNALRHWPTSQVYLFSNLIPLCTMASAHFFLGEPMTPTFWLATTLVISGVFLGQANWQKIFGARWLPFE